MKEFNFEKELLGVQDELFRFAYKLTANREKAEDLLQDTLLKAMLHKESYNKNTNFKGWLFIIMRNTLINGYRRRSVIPACTYPPILHIIRGSWTSPVERRWTRTMTWKRYVMPSKVYRSHISYLLRCTCQDSNTVR